MPSLTFIPFVITVLGAALSAWIAIRVSNAELRRDIRSLERTCEQLQKILETQHAECLRRFATA